jgi:hypothetical protein
MANQVGVNKTQTLYVAWYEKFFFKVFARRSYSKKAMSLAIEMMFDSLDNEEYPYFKHKNDPKKFWEEYRKFWNCLYRKTLDKNK